MKKEMLRFKSFYIFVFIIIFLLSLVLSIFVFNDELRKKAFTSFVPIYNIYQTLAIRSELRNRDFIAINKRLFSQINLSKRFSNSRTSLINGIYDNFEKAFNKAIFTEEFYLLKKPVEELLIIDPEMYMAHIWFAQANIAKDKSITQIHKSLEHINKAIELSSAREEAYRIGIRIALENDLKSRAKNLCNKYFTAQAGGPASRSYGNYFGGTGLRKMALLFNNNKGEELISTNFGLQLNKTIAYEFHLNKKTHLDNFQLIIGSLPGLKIIIEKIILDVGEKQITIPVNDFVITSKSSYIIDTNDTFHTLISKGIDEEIIYFKLYKKIKNVEEVILKINFIRVPLVNNIYCDDINQT